MVALLAQIVSHRRYNIIFGITIILLFYVLVYFIS